MLPRLNRTIEQLGMGTVLAHVGKAEIIKCYSPPGQHSLE